MRKYLKCEEILSKYINRNIKEILDFPTRGRKIINRSYVMNVDD